METAIRNKGRRSLNDTFFKYHRKWNYDIDFVSRLPGGKIIAIIREILEAVVLVEPEAVHFSEYCHWQRQPFTPAGSLSSLEPLEDKPIHLVRKWRCNGRTCRNRPTDCRHCHAINDLLPVLVDAESFDLFGLRDLGTRPVSVARIPGK